MPKKTLTSHLQFANHVLIVYKTKTITNTIPHLLTVSKQNKNLTGCFVNPQQTKKNTSNRKIKNFLCTHPWCKFNFLDNRRLLHQIIQPFPRTDTLMRIIILKRATILQYQPPGHCSFRRHPQRRLQIHIGILYHSMRLSQVFLDWFQRWTITFAQFPYRFRNNFTQIRTFFDAQRTILQSTRIFIRTLTLIEHLEDGTVFDSRL